MNTCEPPSTRSSGILLTVIQAVSTKPPERWRVTVRNTRRFCKVVRKVKRWATQKGTVITHPHLLHFFSNFLSFSTKQFRHIPTAMIQSNWKRRETLDQSEDNKTLFRSVASASDHLTVTKLPQLLIPLTGDFLIVPALVLYFAFRQRPLKPHNGR